MVAQFFRFALHVSSTERPWTHLAAVHGTFLYPIEFGYAQPSSMTVHSHLQYQFRNWCVYLSLYPWCVNAYRIVNM